MVVNHVINITFTIRICKFYIPKSWILKVGTSCLMGLARAPMEINFLLLSISVVGASIWPGPKVPIDPITMATTSCVIMLTEVLVTLLCHLHSPLKVHFARSNIQPQYALVIKLAKMTRLLVHLTILKNIAALQLDCTKLHYKKQPEEM